MKTLEGRVALVTGASRGLGKSIALQLAEDGATLVLVGRDEAKLAESARAVTQQGGNARAFETDVTQDAQIELLKQRVESSLGRVDILVNNAGIMLRKSITDCTPAEWRNVIDTNLTSAFLMCRAFVPLMTGRAYGRIINVTSTLSHVALPGRAAYAASKSGLLGSLERLRWSSLLRELLWWA